MGGKTHIKRRLLKYVPRDLKHIGSPFFGGGGFEMFLRRLRGIEVRGNDLMFPLVNFWQCLFADARAVADAARLQLPYDREKFNLWREMWEAADFMLSGDKWAARYWIMHQAGPVSRSFGYSPVKCKLFMDRSRSQIKTLSRFRMPGITVEHGHYADFLDDYKDFVYCDPPYVEAENVYYFQRGQSFDHHHLAEILKSRESGWILSYNDHPLVRELYAGYEIHDFGVSWNSGTLLGKSTDAREVIIVSEARTGL